MNKVLLFHTIYFQTLSKKFYVSYTYRVHKVCTGNDRRLAERSALLLSLVLI